MRLDLDEPRLKKKGRWRGPFSAEGIPQAFSASWTRAGVNGMCFSRLPVRR